MIACAGAMQIISVSSTLGARARAAQNSSFFLGTENSCPCFCWCWFLLPHHSVQEQGQSQKNVRSAPDDQKAGLARVAAQVRPRPP